MAKQYNIEDSHKGEMLEIVIAVKNPDGTVIDDPTGQTITITVGRTPNDNKILAFNSADEQVNILNVDKGEWYIKLTEEELAGLQEDRAYYYNIWSQSAAGAPRLQAYGRLKRKPAIQYMI